MKMIAPCITNKKNTCYYIIRYVKLFLVVTLLSVLARHEIVQTIVIS